MMWIFECIIILIVAYLICAPKIEIIREFKKKREELREEGDFPKQGKANRAKTLQFMIISSIIIAITFNVVYGFIRKVDVSISMFFWQVLFVLMCESIIGSLWAFMREFILIYKKKGLFIAMFTFVFTIIIVVGMMYVKYKNLILK